MFYITLKKRNLNIVSIFWKEHYTYISTKSAEKMKLEIESFFNDDKKGINLTGTFISDSQFKMWPRWQAMVIRNHEREITYLTGEILKTSGDHCQLKIAVRANSIFLIFSIIFPLAGGLALYSEGFDNNLGPLMIFILGVPIISAIVAKNAKELIRDRFAETFKLTSVVEKRQ